MQFKIPQNVQIEDKIVGPLTLKQLAILGIGGGISYSFYIILARDFFIEVWLPPTAFTAALTLALTFLKINGIPFGRWCLLMLEYLIRPRKRTFIMGGGDHYQNTIFAEFHKSGQNKKAAPKKNELSDTEKRQKISEISKNIDNFSRA